MFLSHKMGEIAMATFMQDWPRTNWLGWIVLKLTKTIKKKTGYACIIGKNYRKPCVVPLIVVVSCKLSFISPSELIKWYRSQKRRKQRCEHLFSTSIKIQQLDIDGYGSAKTKSSLQCFTALSSISQKLSSISLKLSVTKVVIVAPPNNVRVQPLRNTPPNGERLKSNSTHIYNINWY